jgi:putative transposase
VLGIYISEERNMLIAEKFIKSLVEKYGRHIVYIDGDTCTHKPVLFLNLKHRLHSNLEKSLIERVIQYFKDRTESLDDYYPCTNKKNCDLLHVYNWIKLFIYLYNTTIRNKIPFFMNGGEFILS